MALSEELNKHTVVELKSMLAEKGMPVTGKKAELVDRLIEAQTGVPQVDGVTVTREADKGAELAPQSVPGEQTSETTMTSIPNEDGQTTQVDISSDKAAPPTTLVELGVGAEKTAAEIELEKRKARAEKFGIPFVPPAASAPKGPPPNGTTKSKPESKKPSANEKPTTAVAPPAPAPAPAPSAEELAASEEALAKRRAKWGVVEKPGAMQKIKGKLVEKTEAVKAAVTGESKKDDGAAKAEAVPLAATPAERTAEQIEEERRRKAREDRFKSASATEPTNGEGETSAEKRKLDDGVDVQTIEEPAEKKVKV